MTSVPPSRTAGSVTKEDLEAILDSLVEGIVTLNDDGRIIGINRAACEILEVERDEAVGAICCELLGKQLCDSAAAVRDSIRNRRPVGNVQVRVQTRSGREKVLVFQTNLLRSVEHRHRGSVVVLRDVTELATLKQDLARRELENAIEYAFVKPRTGLIGPAHLPTELRAVASPDDRMPSGPQKAESADVSTDRTPLQHRAVEPEAVRNVLAATGWNVAKAARRLGVSRTTLYKHIGQLGIRRPED